MAIYAQFESLDRVEVEVEEGVVQLRGQVNSIKADKQAQTIAERVEGVVAVENDIRQEAKLRERLRPLLEQTRERTSNWLTYLPLLLAAAGVIVLAWLLARVVARRSQRRSESNTFGRQLLDQILRFGILAIGIATALDMIGAQGLLGGLLGTAGVIGIVLGIALKNVGEAYIASIVLKAHRPFDPNDFVRIDDQEGRVVRLTSRDTVLMTVDGTHALIPNSKVFVATIINLTRNPQRRFWFKIGVGQVSELERVQALAVATLASVPGVLDEPAPSCLIEEFGDAEMIVSVAGWIDQRSSDWLKVSSEAKRLIKAAFDRSGVEMPEPSFRIRTTVDAMPIAEARTQQAENDLLREGGTRE